jgi:hypothetical protein
VKNGLKHWISASASEVKNYSTNIIKTTPSNQVRLLIFGQGRTGSTLLESLLVSTGHFEGGSELLSANEHEIRYPIQYILGESKRRSASNFVCHVKNYQLTADRKKPIDVATFLHALEKTGWKIIYLRRRSIFNLVLSSELAQSSGIYHRFGRNLKFEHSQVIVDPERFVRRMKWRLNHEEMEQRSLTNIPFHEVIYEDDLENQSSHQNTVDRLLDYVSLDHAEVQTKLKKVVSQKPEEIISNFDELVNCLKEHELQSFIPAS